MAQQNEGVILEFMGDALLISPITKIIEKLHNNEFRDADIIWLEKKLSDYMKFAAETLFIKHPITEFDLDSDCSGGVLNENVKERYLDYFQKLLKYFKDLIS